MMMTDDSTPYHCPHCQTISYLPFDMNQLDSLTIQCHHCDTLAHYEKSDKPAVQSPLDSTLICPHCQMQMFLTKQDIALLGDCDLSCPSCAHPVSLDDITQPKTGPSFLIFSLIWLVIVSGLFVTLTPHGAILGEALAPYITNLKTSLARLYDWVSSWAFFIR